MGVIGVAVSWPIVTAVNLIFSLFFALKGSPVSIIATLKSIYRPAIASVVMGITLLLSYQYVSSFHVALQMMASMLLGGGIYFIVWVLFPGGYKISSNLHHIPYRY